MSSSGNIIPMKSSERINEYATRTLRRWSGRSASSLPAHRADLELVRERAETIAAMATAKLAEAETRIALLEHNVSSRLAALKDGVDGKDGAPGERGDRGEPGQQDCGADGENGNDGRSFNIRGTWSEAEIYQALDVVALNGASFVARCDNPETCPGEGWQLIAAQGKRGNPGERGAAVKG